MVYHAFLTADGTVAAIAPSNKELDLVTAQAKYPDVVERVSTTWRPRHRLMPKNHHRKVSGTGELETDYEIVQSPWTDSDRNLNAVVHQYVPWDQTRVHYQSIDFGTGLNRRLEKVKTFDRGELVKVVHYAEVDVDGSVSVPVAEERYVTTYDNIGIHWKREGEIQWYDYDGNLIEGSIKHTLKFYHGLEAIEASEKRRSNVNKGLQSSVLGLMMVTMIPSSGLTPAEILEVGRAFMLSHRDELLRYVDSDDPSVVTSVQNAADTWLDNVVELTGPGGTIRDYMLYELS